MYNIELTKAELVALRLAIKDRIKLLEGFIEAGCSGQATREGLLEAMDALEKLGGE